MKKLICLLFIAHYSLQIAEAQHPTEEWVARYTGPSNDLYGPFLQVDKSGNSYVAGTHVINDSINILCVKYSTSGVQQWATLYKYPGEAYFGPSGLAIDSSGNAYVISECGPNSLPPWSGLIVKFNSVTGAPVWAKKYVGQYGSSRFEVIKIDRLNNIYVAGTSDSSHLVIRYTTGGDSVWVRKYHPPACGEYSKALIIDDSLNIIFTGKRRHFYFPGSYDSLLVVKYSPGGVMRWESTYGYSIFVNEGTKITADQNGNLYIGGVTTVSSDGVYLTLKYDRNGVQQWAKIYDAPGSGDNTLRSIAIDRMNNALFVTGGAVTNGVQMATTIKYNILTGDSIWVKRDTGTFSRANNSTICVDSSGYCYTTGGTYNLGLSPFDIMNRKYSDLGNSIWSITYNGPFNGIDYGIDLALDNLRNIYVLGTSQSGFQLSDYVIIKYDQLTGINPVSNTIPLSFDLEQNYPNPFNPETVIKYDLPKDVKINIRIFDYLGREVAALVSNVFAKAGSYEINWNATEFASGVYIYRIEAGEYFCTKKMVLLK